MGRKTIGPARAKRTLVQAGTPIFDAVVADMKFDPSSEWVEPVAKHATSKTVAKRVSKRTPANPKVSA